MSETTTPRARPMPWGRLVALVLLGIAWTVVLWIQSPAYGVFGVVTWTIGAIANMAFTGSWFDTPRGTLLSRSTQALLITLLLVATTVTDVITDASAALSPWLIAFPFVALVYLDFWVWLLRELLLSNRRVLS